MQLGSNYSLHLADTLEWEVNPRNLCEIWVQLNLSASIGKYFYEYLNNQNVMDLLTHLPLDKMAAISQTTFLNGFSWMKILYFYSNFTTVCS